MRVLIACEFSGVVRDAFARRGHDAWSCDLLPTEKHPVDRHYIGDVRDILDDRWDLMIAHPPCTHLAVCGAPSFAAKRADGRQQAAIDFFMALMNAPVPRIAVENPVSVMSRIYRKPDQIVQPCFFGEPDSKKICLWLKNLPKLSWGDRVVEPTYKVFNSKKTKSGKSRYSFIHDAHGANGHSRSRFFQGIAEAMAEQWGGLPVSDVNHQPKAGGE